MTLVPTRISPSPIARQLFNAMVARSTNCFLDLTQTMGLAAERNKKGFSDFEAIDELIREEWIEKGKDGGWMLH